MRRESRRAWKRKKNLPKELGELVRAKKEGKDRESLTEVPVCVDNVYVYVCTYTYTHTCLMIVNIPL